MGSHLERLYGTSMFLILNLAFTLLTGVMYLGIVWALSCWDSSWLFMSSVGYSGVLFSLSMLECFLSQVPTRRVIFFTVPTRIYPVVLMVLLSVR